MRVHGGFPKVAVFQKESVVKHYESYVAEAKARRRRQIALGMLGAVTLATVALAALTALGPGLFA